MMDDVTDTDRAIEDYRARLTAEAELASGDLAEIEDHLRTLIASLQEEGLPVAEAIAEAARRLGEPRQLAREHARVRSPFGARLSRARAWSAVALLAPFLYLQLALTIQHGGTAQYSVELVIGAGVLAALAARLSWARACVLGALIPVLLWDLAWAGGGIASTMTWMQIAAYGGALAFVAPWRRGELQPAGWALALLGPAYSAAATLVWALSITAPGGVPIHAVWGALALVGVLVGGAGVLVRARWAAAAAAVVAVALAMGVVQLWPLHVRLASPVLSRVLVLGGTAAGAAAAAVVAVLAWRVARSNLGTLRGMLA